MMRVGVLGSGQLARMMAQAAQNLNVSFVFVAEPGEATDAVQDLGDVLIAQPTDSAEDLYHLMGCPDVITVEKEHVAVERLKALSRFCTIAPNSKAVAVTQHREREKSFLRGLNIPTADFARATDLETLKQAVLQMGFPVVVKSCEAGYDGKNQWRLHHEADLNHLLNQFANKTLDVVIEQWITFNAEVSMLVVRTAEGLIHYYPLTENRHENGILFTSIAPAPCATASLENTAQAYLKKIADALDYVGVLAMECFVVGDNLLVNELAPRVHNSGHWTQQGCETSQFENHIRAILGLPLGSTHQTQPTGMLNLLGKSVAETDITEPNSVLHWYNKPCRPGRKVGHINVSSASVEDVEMTLQKLEALVYE